MPSHGQSTLSPLSCVSCRQRKVKCDKARPCSACQRSKVDCVFPPRLRLPRGRQGGCGTRTAEITRRLNRLEGLVERLGGEDVLTESLAGGEADAGVAPLSAGAAGKDMRNGSLGVGSEDSSRTLDSKPFVQADGRRYLSGDFWTTLSGEVSSLSSGVALRTEVMRSKSP